MDPYATHLPYLARALSMQGGPIAELGMGDYSTPLLLESSGLRGFTSYENDPVWFEKFAKFFTERNRAILVQPRWEDFRLDYWHGVIFVDLHPPELRAEIIGRVMDFGTILVVHDAKQVVFDWSKFKSSVLLDGYFGAPETMLASNTLGLRP